MPATVLEASERVSEVHIEGLVRTPLLQAQLCHTSTSFRVV